MGYTQKPWKDAEYNIKERLWMKISTKKELKYQPWYNDEGYQPVNPNLINITVLQWVKIGRPRTETFIMVWNRPIRKLKFFAFSIFNDKDGMKILENTFMDTIYVRKTNDSKLQLLRENYVFCRNENEMLLSHKEYPEENYFCQAYGSMIYRL